MSVGKRKERKSKSAEDARGRRNAIRMSGEYTVETVVVADADMVQYHGAEAAQRFLLTVMNMVGLIKSTLCRQFHSLAPDISRHTG